MVAGGMNSYETGDDGVHELRARCERYRSMLVELARIHLMIDDPTRSMQTDEPDWIGRLRKVCLHVKAIDGWEIGAGVEHVMATELRAAYYRMDAVWEHIPAKFRLDEVGDGVWADEAKNGILARYDHPTPQSLMLSAGYGGFRNGETSRSYAHLAVWLGHLGLGYGLALVYLSHVLGGEEDVMSRVTELLHMFGEHPQARAAGTDTPYGRAVAGWCWACGTAPRCPSAASVWRCVYARRRVPPGGADLASSYRLQTDTQGAAHRCGASVRDRLRPPTVAGSRCSRG